MTVINAETLVEEYGEWLARESSFRMLGDWQEITLPFLDRSNDDLCFYAKTDGPSISFTDDGYTLEAFHQNGITLTETRRGRVERIARKYGARIESNGSVTLSSDEGRADALNRYVQALNGIGAVMEEFSVTTG